MHVTGQCVIHDYWSYESDANFNIKSERRCKEKLKSTPNMAPNGKLYFTLIVISVFWGGFYFFKLYMMYKVVKHCSTGSKAASWRKIPASLRLLSNSCWRERGIILEHSHQFSLKEIIGCEG